MKKHLSLLFAGAMMIVLGVACENNEPMPAQEQEQAESRGVDMPFTEYALEGAASEWINLGDVDDPDGKLLLIIDNDEEMKSHVKGDYPPVDFSKKTLLLACGIEGHRVIPGDKNFRQVSLTGHDYVMDVNLDQYIASVITPWQAAIVVDKLDGENKIELNVTQNVSRTLSSDATDYYWYEGKKIPLIANKSYVNVIVGDEFSNFPASSSSFVQADVESVSGKESDGIIKLKFKSVPTTTSEYSKMVSSLKQDGQVKYVLPFFERGGSAEPIGTSDVFYLKLKNTGDITALNKLAEKLGVKIVKKVPYVPLWYVLSIQGSEFSNAVTASNYFYETGQFAAVDPAFMFDFKPNYIPNDPMFSQLWGLSNGSYPNIDINVTNAWDITKGAGIKVAVVDYGIDPNHNDLSPNFHSYSYDAESGTSPSVFIGDDHGTHVAGIVAAEGNNNLQVVGVAPEAKIMRVSHDLYTSSTVSSELASGIGWARNYGADIITNSWGDQGGQHYNTMHSAILESAITGAMTQGRSGKGSVVVFAAGNYGRNGAVMDYPGNFHGDILTVGAIDQTGARSIFNSTRASGYGTMLDVVTPGSNILSTMPYNSTGAMSGTSMAAPHVAGVAALILSVNPNLTQKQVANAIESTTQQNILPYTFNVSKPNGMWNTQVGYGLVDAYAAVDAVITYRDVWLTVFNQASYSAVFTIQVGNDPAFNTTIAAGGEYSKLYTAQTGSSLTFSVSASGVGSSHTQIVNHFGAVDFYWSGSYWDIQAMRAPADSLAQI